MTAKIITTFPNYSITELGEIYSTITNKILKQAVSSAGYYVVCLTNSGIHKNQYIHRLIYEYWVLKDGEVMPIMIDHKDGVRTNNNLNNLRPATAQQNKRNMYLMKTHTSGYKNIRILPSGKFQVQIRIGNGVSVFYLKTHLTLELAIADRDIKLLLYHGEFSNYG